MSTYADDVEFVLSEFVRISRINRKEIYKLPFPEYLCTLPHPSGRGILICGAAAHRRLHRLVDLALSRSQYAGRVEAMAVFTKLKSIIVKRFICENRELNTKEADRAVSAAIRAAAIARTDLTHFIPCHLGHDKTPESFWIGSVHFQPRNIVIERLEPKLQAYPDRKQRALAGSNEPEDGRKPSERLLDNAREYYGSFGWVAEVTIHGSDPSTSRGRATRIVQSALDCLHLLIGAAYSNHMRAGGPGFRTDRRGQIEANANGDVELSLSVDWLNHALGDGWWERVNSEGGDCLIELMGVAIEAGDNIPPAPLAQRFLDGVAWYGEAVRDEFMASRLIKYVTAVERILTTKNEKDLVEALANRGSSLIYNPGEDDIENLRNRFRRVYNLRSGLVHGSRSPLEVGFGVDMWDAEELARSVLFRYLQLFGREGLLAQQFSSRKLDDAYGKLIEWAETTTQSA